MDEIFFVTKVFLGAKEEAMRRVTGKRGRRILCYWLAFVEYFEGMKAFLSYFEQIRSMQNEWPRKSVV